MDKEIVKLNVFFDEPFWVGIFERIQMNKLNVCKVIFVAEPKDHEVLEFLLKNYDKLIFSPTIDFNVVEKSKINPKRRQRDVRKQVLNAGLGTKSQQALNLQREAHKVERKICSKRQRELEQERSFALKQQKRKEKHRGR